MCSGVYRMIPFLGFFYGSVEDRLIRGDVDESSGCPKKRLTVDRP